MVMKSTEISRGTCDPSAWTPNTTQIRSGGCRIRESRQCFARPGQETSPQRTVVIMFDGFGLDYLSASKMPVLEQWKRDGDL